jgi:hypothetical protein
MCTFSVISAFAQPQSSNDSVLKEFTRSGNIEGVTLSFVLLNDKTVDILFTAPGKFAIRASANQATAFYVQGVTDKNIKLDNRFEVEQDGVRFTGAPLNIKNFQGGNVPKGQRIDGILQLDKKLDLSHAFKIISGRSSIDFKLSDATLKQMQQQ